MKVLVTGGSGFLGGYVCEMLAQGGHVVRALVRRSSNRKVLEAISSLEFAEGSVEDAASVDRAAEGVDAVIHCAALVKARNADEFFKTNVDGTKNVLEAAKKAKTVKRFVFVSSLAAIGPSKDGGVISPDQEPNPPPVTNYGRSKLEAERLVRAAKDDLRVVVIRPPLVYGPRDSETLEFFQWVARGVRLSYGDGTNTLSIVYAGDARGGVHSRARRRRAERLGVLRRRRHRARLERLHRRNRAGRRQEDVHPVRHPAPHREGVRNAERRVRKARQQSGHGDARQVQRARAAALGRRRVVRAERAGVEVANDDGGRHSPAQQPGIGRHGLL